MSIVFTHMPGESLLLQAIDNRMMTVKIGLVMMIMKRTDDYQFLAGHNIMMIIKRTDDYQFLVGHNMMMIMKRTDDLSDSGRPQHDDDDDDEENR